MKIAAVVHVFHQAMWPELARYLRNIPRGVALFVSLPHGASAAAILADFPDAQILHVRNVGRDVAPFMQFLPDLLTFDVACKIHTKSDPLWRRFALEQLLGSRELVVDIIRLFDSPRVGIVGPAALWLDGPSHIGDNGPRLRKWLGDRLPKAHGFFGGTMFWLRPAAFSALKTLPDAKFTAHKSTDGYVEHAIERLFGVVPAVQSLMVGMTDTRYIPRVRIYPPTWPGKQDFDPKLIPMPDPA